MKTRIAIAALMMATVPMAAQETYENAKIAQEDLNGTARYVGMGGAMEALGADISTIATNPAGIGLFRKSSISASMGVVMQDGVSSSMGADKTNVSFDQAGFVWSTRMNNKSFLNFAFNYHKSRNFNQILTAADDLDNASFNKLTYAKGVNELLFPQRDGVNLVNYDADGKFAYYNHQPLLNELPAFTCTQLDDMLATEYNYYEGNWSYDNANGYQFGRAHKGYIGEYDFNISGNLGNSVYLGLTVGIHDVHYKHYSEQTDFMHTTEMTRDYQLTVADNREITGTGFDAKLGVIVRPIEKSPFRVGVYVHTPTFYTLTTSNYTVLTDGSFAVSSNSINEANPRTSYKFKLRTPWKFGASLGHTIGQNVALGLTYEYADYSSLDTRYITDSYYDDWNDSYYDNSESDKAMNMHTESTLKGVHTLKVGAEYKPIPSVALRIGYNYVSPMYEKDGYRDGSIDSFGTYVASTTDFTNWEDTHRFTLGAGYTYQKFNISLAYQYSQTNGKFYPFMSYSDAHTAAADNIADGVKVSNKRNQLLLTLGYTF